METQQQDLGEQLQAAVMQAAIDAAVNDDADASVNQKKSSGKGLGKGGVPVPGGRPKGVPNKVTRTIREAVEAAAKPGGCHPDGLAGWLIERAQGGLGDRQIFAAMVSKAMPLQVQANVDGGIKIQLGWLGQRNIGTTAAQIPDAQPQSIDLEQESDGTYRIIDQQTQPAGAGQGAAAGVDGQAGQGAASGTTAQNDAGAAQGE
jgi:hypothetical protein